MSWFYLLGTTVCVCKNCSAVMQNPDPSTEGWEQEDQEVKAILSYSI